MNERDDLLRAHVFAAFDARGPAAFHDACVAVVDGYLLWPQIAYHRSLELARNDVLELEYQQILDRANIDQNIATAIDAIRESYPEPRSAAA